MQLRSDGQLVEEPVRAEMLPEYGTLELGDLLLESGEVLKNAHARFEWAGNRTGPAILVCHALTGNEQTVGTKQAPGWWSGLIGPGRYIDTSHYQILTINTLGGCNGSSGPLSINNETGEPYRMNFPFFTIRDMVNFQKMALDKLRIRKLAAVIGGSLGGMQALEWGCMYPEKVEQVIAMAVTPFLSDYAIAYNRIGIEAIMNDPGWNHGNYKRAEDVSGLKIARMVGLVTYRSDALFNSRFNRRISSKSDGQPPLYEVESYLRYQGEKLTARFDPNSYLYLLYAMNSHDIGIGRGGCKEVLKRFQPKLNVICFSGDLLYKGEQINE